MDQQIDVNVIPVSCLTYSTRKFLGIQLNREQNLLSRAGYSRDYHGLAEQMNFSYAAVKNFEQRTDVTMAILEAWQQEQDASLGKLMRFLENMGRHDIIEDTEALFERDMRSYMRKRPVQVPEVTSCPSQLSSLDLNVLTRDDACTGEVTLYDAYISYADADLDFVYNLTKVLEASGFKLFIRCRDLLAGHSEYEINMELIKSRCKRVLIVLSPAFLNCAACEVQAGFATSLGFDERRRKIIPILWKPCEIPLILRYISRIDFTKPGVQDWIWDQLKSSLQDVTSSTFVSSEKRVAPEFAIASQIEPDTSNPAITFPPTGSYGQNSAVNSGACTSSVDNVYEETQNDSPSSTTLKISSQLKPKNRLSTLRFWQSKKVSKKEGACSSASVSSSSNATSGFHSQSGNALESIDSTNEASSQDTSV